MKAQHISIGLAILVIGGIFGYVIAKNNAVEFTENHSQEVKEQVVDETESGKYFLVPELRVKFENVPGFTPIYLVSENNPIFLSKEVIALAMRDPRFTGCILEGFSSITITSVQVSSNDPIDQTPIGNGKYINKVGPQAVCWNAPNLTVEQQNVDPNVKEYQAQASFFSKFIKSARAY
jgi:hypothetical protein